MCPEQAPVSYASFDQVPQHLLERRGGRVSFNTARIRRQARKNFIETQQALLQPEGMSLQQEIGLRVLLPDTYQTQLQPEDIKPYVEMVAKDFVAPHTEGTTKEKLIKGARLWGGLALGSAAFWALPWSTIALDYTSIFTQTARTVSSIVPYFALNLPDSAVQYKNLLKLTSASTLQLLALPVLVGLLGVWEVRAYLHQRNRTNQVFSQLLEEKVEGSRRELRKTAKIHAKAQIEDNLRIQEREIFAQKYPEQLDALRQVLPTWTEDARIDLLETDMKESGRQAVKDSLVFVGTTLAIPLLAFAGMVHLSSTQPSLETANPFLSSLPFVAASLTSMIVRRNLMRLYKSAKDVKKRLTRTKEGQKLLEKYQQDA